jgi:predicted Zn-dependent peptidase
VSDKIFEEVKVAKNGIRYFLEENHTFPSLSVGIFVKSGSRYERDSSRGIAHFIEHTVFKGTKKRTAFEISREIEKLGGEINAYTSSEHTLFYVKLLSKDAEKGFDILSDILKHPTFENSLIEKERGVILEEIQEYFDDPQDICQTEALKSIWGEDSAANNPLGREETVKTITVEELKKYFKKFFNSNNIFVSVAGDIDDRSLNKFVERKFSDFNSETFTPEVDKPRFIFNQRKFKKDAAQVHIAFTFKGSKLFSRQNVTGSIFNTILGGNMSSRLFQKLREERGLVYTIYTYPVRLSDVGATVIYASTTRNYQSEVEDIIMGEIENIRKDGLCQAEFEDAKSFVSGNLILGLESTSSKMQRNGIQGLFEGKVKKSQSLLAEIQSVNLDEVNSYAKDMLDVKLGKAVVGRVDG